MASGNKLQRTAVHQFFKRADLPKTSTETSVDASGQTMIHLFYHAEVRATTPPGPSPLGFTSSIF
jgi:hypothetical protein